MYVLTLLYNILIYYHRHCLCKQNVDKCKAYACYFLLYIMNKSMSIYVVLTNINDIIILNGVLLRSIKLHYLVLYYCSRDVVAKSIFFTLTNNVFYTQSNTIVFQ